MINFQKGFAWFPILLVIVGVGIVSGGAYFIINKNVAPVAVQDNHEISRHVKNYKNVVRKKGSGSFFELVCRYLR